MKLPRLFPFLGLLLALAALPDAAAPAAGPPGAPRYDSHGDPLPKHAIARLGTTRWRVAGGVSFVSFLPDGKTILTADGSAVLQFWDATDGRELRRLETGKQGGRRVANIYGPEAATLSADGKQFAFSDGLSLQVWDLEAGKHVRTVNPPQNNNGMETVRFLGGGKYLAAHDFGRAVMLWDAKTGTLIREFAAGGGGNEVPQEFALSPDGKTLHTIGQNNDLFVRSYEVATGKETRKVEPFKGKGEFFELIRCTPDGARAVLVDPNRQLFKVFDLTEGKVTHSIKVEREDMGRFGLSADGKRLIGLFGQGRFIEWDLVTGKEVRKTGKDDAPDRAIFGGYYDMPLALSPDGKHAVEVLQGQVLRVIETETGKDLSPDRGHSAGIYNVWCAPDGRTVFTHGADGTLRTWDRATGQETRQQGASSNRYGIAISPDMKTLATVQGTRVTLTDLATGKPAGASEAGKRYNTIAFSPDGKYLLARQAITKGDTWVSVNLLDAKTGKHVRELIPGVPVTVEPGRPRPVSIAGPVRMSKDGQWLASMGLNYAAVYWDLAAGVEQTLPLPPRMRFNHVAFSPDGRLLAFMLSSGEVSLWETASGRSRGKLERTEGSGTVEFSPDGRLIATSGERKITLYDARTLRKLGEVEGHRSTIYSLAFTPDGNTLISGSNDTTALVWDLSPFRAQVATALVPLVEAARKEHWEKLTQVDAEKAYPSVEALANDPKGTVAFLATELKPVEGVDAARVRGWIKDLDNDRFVVREAARLELEKQGDRIKALLEEGLKDKPSAEVRRALTDLLGSAQGRTLTGEQLRVVRAVDVLERIGGADATAALKKLTAGAGEDFTTRQARLALERMGVKE